MEKHDKDHMNFMKIFFNSMMRSLRFESIGPKQFNAANAHTLDAHKIKVWPGFDSRLIMKENGALLNVDVCFKVIRTDTVLKYLNELKQGAERQKKDPVEYVNAQLAGTTVVTRYNSKTYKIDRVDFAQSPLTEFDKQGTPTSYKDYYKTRYNEEIKETNQPLLINKDRRTG